MSIKYWMSKEGVSIDLNDSMQKAIYLLKEKKIRKVTKHKQLKTAKGYPD